MVSVTGGEAEAEKFRGLAMKQCLLTMKNMRDNGEGRVFRFVTTKESWRMLSYDGAFQVIGKMEVTFDTMNEGKET